MHRVTALLLLSLAACGGAVAPSDDPPACDAEQAFCEQGGPHSHGEYITCDGGIAYTCCSNTTAEIDHLIEAGEKMAAECLGK